MGNHTRVDSTDPALSVPGHTAHTVYIIETRQIGLHCDEDGWFGGSFRPDRWREKHMREAWDRHVAHAATGAVIKHGLASNVAEKICVCVSCSIASRAERAQ